MGLVSRHGYAVTPRAEDAEILVVNTCSFIESARQESVDAILEMAEHKKHGRARKLIVAGCLVERYRRQIQAEIPEVDAVVGTNELEAILAACAGSLAPPPPAGAAVLPPILSPAASPQAAPLHPRPTAPYLYDHLTPRLLSTPPHTAYLKIAEGCDHPCSFCVIPQFRGAFRSRRFESVITEARQLAARGAREAILIGQDTTCYGQDLGLRDGLADLLARLAEIEELDWVRALYFYPNKITPRLLETIAAHPRLCKYLDMPLQHASPAVLKRMKRGGGGEIFLKLLERIRQTIPGVSLRTTFIVGFPGETEADFQYLMDFVAAAQFDWLGVFGYSDEENSRSHALDGKVDARTIAARRHRLMAAQRKISRQRRRAMVGRCLPVMVEGPSEETDLLWQGRVEGQAPEIDGKVLINDFGVDATPPAVGRLAWVEITAAQDYDLVGRIVAAARPDAEPMRELGAIAGVRA